MTDYVAKICLLLLVGCLISSPGRADMTSDPCASEWKQFSDSSTSTPEQHSQAIQALTDCRAREKEQKKKELAETGTAWAATLDKLPDGGWVLLYVKPDGTYAVFGSRRHETRKGSTVTIWQRAEYRETQSDNGTSYKSRVDRIQYDCERMRSKEDSVAYYKENNLSEATDTNTYDESKVAWTPMIPGTVGDSLLEWACRTPKAQPAKAH